MTDHSGNGSHGNDDIGASLFDAMGSHRSGPGNAASKMVEDILGSILNGPPRLGHPANPRHRSSDGGMRMFDLSRDLDEVFGDDDLFGGSPFGSSSDDPLDVLGKIFGDDVLDTMGKGEVKIMAIGPNGPHLVHSGEAKLSDIRRIKNGEDPLGFGDMLKGLVANPPSRNQSKLSLMSLLDDRLPLTLKLYMYAGRAGAEVVRFIADPDANTDFAFINHLAGTLKRAQDNDKAAFGNVQRRLKGHGVDLAGLIKAIDKFIAKPTINTAKSVQMRLAVAAPVALALMDDVHDDERQITERLTSQLRRNSQI